MKNKSALTDTSVKQAVKVLKTHTNDYIVMTDSLKAAKRKNLRKYIHEIKPFVDEIKVLWEDEEKEQHESNESR